MKNRSGQGGKLSLSVFVDGASVFEKSAPVGWGPRCAAGSTSAGPGGWLSGGREVVLKSALPGPDAELQNPARWSPAGGCLLGRPAGARAPLATPPERRAI